MKALIYKEFRLSMHPICYLFIFLFPMMILIPSYPIAIGFIYILTCYPILFLGANKGQQSNDLLYSALLPVRKKDIVLARIITVLTMQITFILLSAALVPLATMFRDAIIADGGELEEVGLGLSGFVSVVALMIVGLSLADLIFFPIYYKKGKSIVASTLLTILGFILYLLLFTVLLPYLPIGAGYVDLLCNRGLPIQFAFLGGAILISAVIHFFVYKISAKRLEKVDF